ncbi:hypothetical protein I312_106477 [Cryptococcus bacillisporus CA1280]|uniref:uncharacterized protein n=1 Tax=Cryptococcus bacillisporus CA1280 TaxID=1296109 RepID=UPI00336900CA
MRGEHCVAGATILSIISVILLIFAHIGQVSSGALVKSIYMAEVNVAAYGNGFQGGTNTSGLRQYYRFGMYNACGYQKDGGGICNTSTFAYPMEPLGGMIGDVPAKFRKQTVDIIPTSTFKDNSYNHGMTRAGTGLIFVGSCGAALALIFGVIKLRLTFFIASICASVGAFLLMLGAALWTAVIAKDAWLQNVKVQHGYKLGIYVTAGPSLYLVWVAFAFTSLSCLPYVIACCTYRK